MASTANENGNLVDEFEESFQACVHALTKQEASTGIDKNEIGLEVEQTTSKFIDLARQMESFFIQKRFLLSALKPELMLKEENLDLRYEINRKDELIKKHYERIEMWKNMLSDQQQQQQHAPPPPPHVSGMPPIGHAGMPPSDMRALPMGMPPKNQPGPITMGGMTSAMQAQLQAQHMQQQQQQQHMMQAQQMQQMQVGGPPMFSPQNAMGSPRPGAGAGGGIVPPNNGNFSQSPNVFQGPLAYLEKTTSNIGIDGRR